MSPQFSFEYLGRNICQSTGDLGIVFKKVTITDIGINEEFIVMSKMEVFNRLSDPAVTLSTDEEKAYCAALDDGDLRPGEY